MKNILLLFVSVLTITSAYTQESLYDQANKSLEGGKFEEALQYFKDAGAAFSQGGISRMYTLCKLGEADAYLGLGQIDIARSIATGTEKFISTIHKNDQELVVKSKMTSGNAYLRSGRIDLALENLKSAEALLDESGMQAAECFDDLGVIYTTNGNNELALQYLQKALAIRQAQSDNQILVADSYNNIGRVYLNDEPLQAIIFFNRALNIYTEKLGKTHPKVAVVYSNMAFANANQSNYNDALTYLDQVAEIYGAIYPDDHPNKAFTLNNQGRILEMKGDFEGALEYQSQALNMYLDLYGTRHPEVANTYFLIGSIHQKTADYPQAIEAYQKSIYANLFDQDYSDIYTLPEIRDYFNADILLTSLQSKAQSLEAYHYSKTLRLKDINSALNTLIKCDELITQIRQIRFNEADKLKLGEIASQIYENGIGIATYLSERTFKKDYYRNLAFNFCERSKSSILLSAINDTNAKQFAGIPESELAIEDSLKNEIGFLEQRLAQLNKEEEIQQVKIELLKYQNALRDFIDRLETRYPEYYDLKYNTELAGISQIQSTLDERAALLSYFIGAERVFIFQITKDKAWIYNRPKDERFNQLVSGFRNSIKYYVDETFTTTSYSLQTQLIPKLSDEIDQLVIIPDAVIGSIPFEALVYEKSVSNQVKDNKYLINKYAVGYDYAATLFVNKAKNTTVSDKTGILLAAPVTFESNGQYLQQLPDSKKEIEEIEKLFSSAQMKTVSSTGPDASEEMIKSISLSDFQFIHLATHGIVNQSRPELSRVFLCPGSTEDGSLYSGEIYNLKFNANLVTLSACETGLGQVAKGEGIVGLSRALQYAGAQNLIVSLWQVADKSTADLMIEFYNHSLNSPRRGYADDLRAAKLSLLQSEDYYNPYFWAPFILIGQ
ncbi:MAG: CHAT domain-containing protein [Cyclobacteriaceae bacterium]|nr:CHAT domain-containing protein [Cyclobacteriaceae bacterium SS2]